MFGFSLVLTILTMYMNVMRSTAVYFHNYFSKELHIKVLQDGIISGNKFI